jgi:hypothetical protein
MSIRAKGVLGVSKLIDPAPHDHGLEMGLSAQLTVP